MLFAPVLALLTLLALTTAAPTPDPQLGGVLGRTLTGTVSSLVGSVPALLETYCSSAQKCTVNITGEIENILGDGSNYVGQASVSGWMDHGHAWGNINLAGKAPLPLKITCNAVADVCTGTVSGNLTQVFANGQQIALWGWLTPSGHCDSGVCVGSITATGDPGYKMA